MDTIEEIKKLKALLDQGAITQDEFDGLKKKILKKEEEPKLNLNIPSKSIGRLKEDTSESIASKIDDTHTEQNKSSSVLSQERIDELVATTDEFWNSFYQSLVLPFSYYNNYKEDSFDKWVKRVSSTPDLKSHLELLFEYALLKGEFLIVFYQGFVLTNYRLIINDTNAGKPSIPLSNLKKYERKNDCRIVYERNGQSITLRYDSFLLETFVDAAKARFMEKQLNEVQMELISKSIEEIKYINPHLEIPKVDSNPKVVGIITNTISQQMPADELKSIRGKKLVKNLLIAAAVIGFCWFVGNAIFSPSSDSSSSSSDQSESTQIKNQSPDQKIGQFLIDNTFADNENGFTFYMKFTSLRDGTYGAVTLSMGACDAVYSYSLSGRIIQMTFTGTTCPNTSGSSTSATFNYDNTISLFYKGEQFRFKPL